MASSRPTFLVIGCEKCGTTSLCAMLAQHPDVFVATPKEPHFLSYDYARGWDYYESLFAQGKHAKARGEGSVSYASHEYEDTVCQRLREHLPDVRLIYLARDPVKRIESSYRMLHDGGHRTGVYLPFSMAEALRYRPHLIQTTLYWQRINAYRRHFADEQILVLFQEDLARDPQTALQRAFAHIGVDPAAGLEVKERKLNRGQDKCYDTPMMRALRTNALPRLVWGHLPWRMQAAVEQRLRKPFVKPIAWQPQAMRMLEEQVVPDARRFLEFYGKPAEFWPTTAAADSALRRSA